MPSKSRDQKYGDLQDTHRILKVFYSYSTQGVPAGCSAAKIPMTGVPTWHRKQADYLLKCLKEQQVVKLRLAEEQLRKWEMLVKSNPRASLFWFRDHLPSLLSGLSMAQGKPQTKLQRLLNSPVLVMQDGTELLNDRQQFHFVEGDEPDTLRCFLSGQTFKTEEFQ